MTYLLILPILIPMLTGVVSLVFWTRIRTERTLSLIGVSALLGVAVALFLEVWNGGDAQILTMQMGDWPAPFGITFAADLFSAIMVLLTGTIGLMTTIYSTVNIDRQRVAHGYYPLVNFLLMGICGAFLTGDMFNLYVWFEVLLISSFVLLGLGVEADQLQGTLKYVVINLVSSTIFLSGLGILYGVAGTLNMADAAVQLAEVAQTRPGLVTTLAMIFLVAFAIKAAMFPLFFWMPASYHTPPVSISALFAGLLTKVGVYSLIRIFTLIFVHDAAYTHRTVLLWMAGLTMVIGVFGAMSQMEMRRILAFHSVSQVGYMVLGLALAMSGAEIVPLALAGTIIYIIHHSVVKSNLFLISGVVRWLRGSAYLKKTGGLITTRPYLSVLFFIAAMSLAGLPPLSGFWAKLTLVQAGLSIGHSWIVAVALFTGVWTMYSMTKIWSYVFWNKPKGETSPNFEKPIDYSFFELSVHIAPILLLVVATVLLGLFAEPVIAVALTAANQLLEPSIYIKAVMP